jgi:hypothetical protein
MRARKSAAARPRIQDFPGHSEAAQTSMSEQARFPKSQSSPLLPSFSLPVELTRRQRHMQEHRCTQAVHKFSRCKRVNPDMAVDFVVVGHVACVEWERWDNALERDPTCRRCRSNLFFFGLRCPSEQFQQRYTYAAPAPLSGFQTSKLCVQSMFV